MKKFLSLLLALVMVLSLAACGGNTKPTEKPTDAPTAAPTEKPTEAPTTAPTEEPTEEPTENNEAKLYMISVSLDDKYISISDNDMGELSVDYNNGIRKMTTMSLETLAEIETELEKSGLKALLGTSEYGDGADTASLSLVYSDWSSESADYYGVEIPEAFTTGFNTFAAYMETLLADVPEYVPQAMVMGEVDAAILTEMQTIMNNSGIANLDSLAILPIALDEYFGFTAGLTNTDGITAGAICQNMMMGGAAYQVVIVTLEDESKAADVAADFEANLDFGKWVCTRPTDALIAQKGNMVLCLMGPDEMYTGTVSAIEAAEWTTIKTVADPGV